MFAILDLHRARGLRGGRFARRAVLSVGQSARKPLPRCLSQASWFAVVLPRQARERGGGRVGNPLERRMTREGLLSLLARVFHTFARLAEETTQSSSAGGRATLPESGQLTLPHR